VFGVLGELDNIIFYRRDAKSAEESNKKINTLSPLRLCGDKDNLGD
jgi:hypothetical protein